MRARAEQRDPQGRARDRVVAPQRGEREPERDQSEAHPGSLAAQGDREAFEREDREPERVQRPPRQVAHLGLVAAEHRQERQGRQQQPEGRSRTATSSRRQRSRRRCITGAV
nr:hypothetical protein GCM10025732_43490 [Glycomyces mayteni]